MSKRNSTQKDKVILQASLAVMTVGATALTTGMVARMEQLRNATPDFNLVEVQVNAFEALPTLVPTLTVTPSPTTTPIPEEPTPTQTPTFIPIDPVPTETATVLPTAPIVLQQEQRPATQGRSSR